MRNLLLQSPGPKATRRHDCRATRSGCSDTKERNEANAVTLRLKGAENLNVVARDVYNAKSQALRVALCARSTTEALMEKLRSEGFEHRTKLGDKGEIKILSFKKQDAICLVWRFSRVLLIDFTYNNNEYGMPLLNIAGVNCCGFTFSAAFAF
ncbi:hypothetical protein PsorP6_017190 [Peronosclerospora sorghi]|uniref:Uncharacterized protein n=1 Tax=Peronosclerospora sorghi TaxID=230839 RepID=A0ACC0WDV0_9STRA|nr:hypothetical protein PsorP6_017190 [Peronosclerospora sorghi]